jgi:hypothetical protein
MRGRRRVVEEVEDAVEAVGVLVAGGGGEIGAAGQQLADAEFAQVGLVLGERGGDAEATTRSCSPPRLRSRRRSAPARRQADEPDGTGIEGRCRVEQET